MTIPSYSVFVTWDRRIPGNDHQSHTVKPTQTNYTHAHTRLACNVLKYVPLRSDNVLLQETSVGRYARSRRTQPSAIATPNSVFQELRSTKNRKTTTKQTHTNKTTKTTTTKQNIKMISNQTCTCRFVRIVQHTLCCMRAITYRVRSATNQNTSVSCCALQRSSCARGVMLLAMQQVRRH